MPKFYQLAVGENEDAWHLQIKEVFADGGRSKSLWRDWVRCVKLAILRLEFNLQEGCQDVSA